MCAGRALASVQVVHGSGPKAVNECLVTTRDGNISRIRLSEFRICRRQAKGVRVVALQSPTDELISATPCLYDHDSEHDTDSADVAE